MRGQEKIDVKKIKKVLKKIKKGVDFLRRVSYNSRRVTDMTQKVSAFSSVGRAVDS